MEEDLRQQLKDSDLVFNLITGGKFETLEEAKIAVITMFLPDQSISRSGISHAVGRLEKYYTK
jgi:hypothetical protein